MRLQLASAWPRKSQVPSALEEAKSRKPSQARDMAGQVGQNAKGIGPPLLTHDHILELPWVYCVDVLGEEGGTALKRSPVRILPNDRPKIAPLHLATAAEVECLRLDDSRSWILKCPDHASEHRGRHLKPSGILIRRNGPRLFN